jgi:hypothetical protein
VNRQGLPFETLGPRPNYSGDNLKQILDLLWKSSITIFTYKIISILQYFRKIVVYITDL